MKIQKLFQATKGHALEIKRIANRTLGNSGAIDERWLQQVLASTAGTEILQAVIVPQSSYHKQQEVWHVLGTETQVPGIGSIDVLYVTGSGRPVIVETKLARNPEARREVIAQVAEYAIGLRSIKAADLIDVVEADEELSDLIPSINAHLAAGSLDLIVVGDEIDSRALALGDYLINRDPTNQMSIWFVEIGLFEPEGAPDTRIIVAYLRQASIAEVRHVIDVSVTIEPDKSVDTHVSMRVVDTPLRTNTSRGPKLTETELLSEIHNSFGLTSKNSALKLLDQARSLDLHIGLRPRSASIRITNPSDHTKKLTIFVITTAGTFYVGWTERWHADAGIPQIVADTYISQLADLFDRSPEGRAAQPYTGVPLDLVADKIESVLEIVSSAVYTIRSSGVSTST